MQVLCLTIIVNLQILSFAKNFKEIKFALSKHKKLVLIFSIMIF